MGPFGDAYVVRTSEEFAPAIFSKLQSGSARIGWSSGDHLDLDQIVLANQQGGWADLTPDQKDAWYCHGFIDRVKVDDLLFYPNVPEYGSFCVVQVTGPYSLVPQLEGIRDDFRSARPCRLLTPVPVQKTERIVTSHLRNKIGKQRRFYQLNVPREDIGHLLQNLDQRDSRRSDFTLSFSRMMEPAHQEMARRWPHYFPKAELSRFLAEILERHGHDVELREGPSEKGSDLVIELNSDFLNEPVVVGVQVGSYEGDVTADCVRKKLDQLLAGWNDNLLSHGALVLSGTWTESAREVLDEHNRTDEHRKVKGIDGKGLAKIMTRTTWMKDE